MNVRRLGDEISSSFLFCFKTSIYNFISKPKQKKAKRDEYSNNSNNGNKTWKRNADNSTKQGKKDLAAFVKKEVNKGVQKELAKNKRKADDEDLNALDSDLEEQLKEFNYEGMENLNLNSDESDGDISC